jgi:tRNA pseudouridine32 synthase / 23S rRNA pseudouridine746 synthase
LPLGDWRTVLEFLSHRFPSIARDVWIERMKDGLVLDDTGCSLPPDSTFRAHRTVFYYRHVHDEPRVPFEETILFQDDLLIAVDKPPFVPVVASGRHVRDTLLARLKRRFGIDAIAPLHRLDRGTAGVVLFSIQPQTRGAYTALFRERRIRKEYEAIGAWRGDLELPLTYLSRLEEGPNYMQMREVSGTPNSETRIELLDVAGSQAHYRLSPHTGKKHQLRAHMAALGTPIVNDRLYPVLQPFGPDDYTKPLQLLAKSLAFIDPITGRERRFESVRQIHL